MDSVHTILAIANIVSLSLSVGSMLVLAGILLVIAVSFAKDVIEEKK